MNHKQAVSTVVVVAIAIIIIASSIGAYYLIDDRGASTTPPSSAKTLTSSESLSSSSMTATDSSTASSPLILYAADAYVKEASALENAFMRDTGVQMVVPPKSGGSTALGQQIAQGNPVSVFLSVAKSAVSKSILNTEFSGWAIAFVTDQMAITYSNITSQSSAAMAVINSYKIAVSSNTTQAWSEFFSNITSGSVKVGISNPNSDPAGFRAWLVLQAAGYLYANNNSNFFVNRMLTNHGNVTAASAADLVAPLQSGNIQFLFVYKSAAIGRNLNLMQLPGQINLGNPDYNSFYSKFSYSTTTGVQTGGLVSLFITVPKDSTDFADSLSFVAFVVRNSSALLTQYGLVPLTPAMLYNDTSVPLPIQQLISQGSLTVAGPL